MALNETMKQTEQNAVEGSEPRTTQQKAKPSPALRKLLKRAEKKKTGALPEIINALKKRGRIVRQRLAESILASPMPEDKTAPASPSADTELTYDKLKKDLTALRQHIDLYDHRLLAECVYTAKFLTEGQAKRLVDAVCESAGEEKAKAIRYDALLTDRVKTNNQTVIFNIAAINDAMSRELDGQRHIPEKISFQYLKPAVNELTEQAQLNRGDRLVVSPFKLMINSGRYYLLAFDDDSRLLRTYRVDRMEDIERTGQAREGAEIFSRIDPEKYARRVFSTGGDRTEQVKLQFPDRLLEAAIERFGTSDASYTRADDTHFIVTADIGIDDRFFGWLTGLGKDVRIIEPASVAAAFTEYLDTIRKQY